MHNKFHIEQARERITYGEEKANYRAAVFMPNYESTAAICTYTYIYIVKKPT